MRDTVVVAIVAFICITIIAVAGLAMGHDTAVIAGAMSSIAGTAGAVGAYKASKAKYPRWHDERVKKEEKKDE